MTLTPSASSSSPRCRADDSARYIITDSALTTRPYFTTAATSCSTITIRFEQQATGTSYFTIPTVWAEGAYYAEPGLQDVWRNPEMEARTQLGAPAIITPDSRARELFLSLISPEQRAQFEREQQVLVRARQTGRRYLIECNRTRHGNIIELGQHDEHLARLCVAPGGNIPHFDAILGQIVALEHDEQHVRDTANFTPLVAGYQRRVA